MNRVIKSRAGHGVSPAEFNANIDRIQDQLNNLESGNFAYMIDRDKMAEDTLQRVDVSSRGGASKVLELTGDGDIRHRCAEGNTSCWIGNSATNAMIFDFATRRVNFKMNDTIGVYIDYTGWN